MKKICRQTRLSLIDNPDKQHLPDDLKSHLQSCQSCSGWLRNSQRLEAMWQLSACSVPGADEIDAARQNAIRKIRLGNDMGTLPRWFLEHNSWKTAWAAALAVVVFASGIYIGILMRRLPPDTVRSAGQAIPNWIMKAIQSKSAQLPGNVNTAGLGFSQLLAYMVKYDQNAGHRLNSVKELASIEDDKLAQEALIYALLNDQNPGVRMRAIKSLAQRPVNRSLRDAYIYALWHDDNPGVRVQAVDALTPMASETEVMQTLQFVAISDQDEGVRSLAQEAIRHVQTG
jgi:hypothetical protein